MREKLENQYVKIGLTLFFAGTGIILFFFFCKNFGTVRNGASTLVSILMPFIYGFVIAYLLMPIYNGVVRNVYQLLQKYRPKKKAFFFSKIVGTVATILFLFLVVGAAAALLLPQLIESGLTLVNTVPSRLTELNDWITKMLSSTKYGFVAKYVDQSSSNTVAYLTEWLNENILPNATSYIAKISTGIFMTVKTVLNLLIGVIVVVYVLNSKDRFKGQTRKIINASFKRSTAREIFEFGNFVNRTFGGFINGKIIDSLIIGVICFVFMSIFHMPYAALCSTIVGVTNIIPFFGPFIGAIPSAIIICVSDPIKAGEFLILIIALQQFDGNILGPKILGETTGLASFWVMFSIILFGGMFGFLGMVVGVPVFAVFYYYFKRYIERRLRRKNLPVETAEYEEFNSYNINRKDIL